MFDSFQSGKFSPKAWTRVCWRNLKPRMCSKWISYTFLWTRRADWKASIDWWHTQHSMADFHEYQQQKSWCMRLNILLFTCFCNIFCASVLDILLRIQQKYSIQLWEAFSSYRENLTHGKGSSKAEFSQMCTGVQSSSSVLVLLTKCKLKLSNSKQRFVQSP